MRLRATSKPIILQFGFRCSIRFWDKSYRPRSHKHGPHWPIESGAG